MRVLILAGGLGTRLQSVVPDLPKPMALVNHRPFLEYLMDYWIGQGAKEFYISVCYLAEKIKGHFGSQYQKIPITYFEEPHPLGTGGALLWSLNKLQDKDSELLVLNGDTFLELKFSQMQTLHQQRGSSVTIVLREVEENNRYSGVIINSQNQIIQFCEREQNSPALLINAGAYLIKPRLFLDQGFLAGEKFSLEDDFFPKLIHTVSTYSFVTNGKFIDIGIPLDYQKSQTFFQYA